MFMYKHLRKTIYFSAILWLLALLVTGCQTSPNKQAAPAANDSTANKIEPASPPSNFKHAYAKVNGIDIHYVVGGRANPWFYCMALGKTGICGIVCSLNSPNILR